MPLYEYKCASEHLTTKLISHSLPEAQKEKQPCDACGEVATRIISLGSFELKGDWFKTKGSY